MTWNTQQWKYNGNDVDEQLNEELILDVFIFH